MVKKKMETETVRVVIVVSVFLYISTGKWRCTPSHCCEEGKRGNLQTAGPKWSKNRREKRTCVFYVSLLIIESRLNRYC